MDDRWEAASYAWVRIEQLGHFCGVACEDHDEVITAIFDLLDKCVESFAAKAVLRVLDKRVRFINKEHTTERTLDDVGNFDGSLPLVCSDEATTVNLDKMAAPKLPECTEYAGDGAPVVILGALVRDYHSGADATVVLPVPGLPWKIMWRHVPPRAGRRPATRRRASSSTCAASARTCRLTPPRPTMESSSASASATCASVPPKPSSKSAGSYVKSIASSLGHKTDEIMPVLRRRED
mmetsp:Transcript_15223/g.45562  ORF Transcript_15223/g.45562 Transcript_15223/m.45562 type:complete len:237 (+) Transcript_15223:237-947(+)